MTYLCCKHQSSLCRCPSSYIGVASQYDIQNDFIYFLFTKSEMVTLAVGNFSLFLSLSVCFSLSEIVGLRKHYSLKIEKAQHSHLQCIKLIPKIFIFSQHRTHIQNNHTFTAPHPYTKQSHLQYIMTRHKINHILPFHVLSLSLFCSFHQAFLLHAVLNKSWMQDPTKQQM